MRLRVTIQVNGVPLRRAYVEHIAFGFVAGVYMTDDNGEVRDDNDDEGIEAGPSRNADIRVLCQNSIARVLNGTGALVMVTQDFKISDRSVVNINTTRRQRDHYEILNRIHAVYETVFRQFRPFADSSRRDFPLKKKTTFAQTKDQKERIEVSFPSQFPLGNLAFVEPSCQSTGFPLVHFRDRVNSSTLAGDGRLFGEVDALSNPNRQQPILVSAEFSHALHFSLFTNSLRGSIQTDYMFWIMGDFATGGGGTHSIGKQTDPKVAFIEAFDHFSHRYAEFIRRRVQGATSNTVRLVPQRGTNTLRRRFLDSEIGVGTEANAVGTRIATLNPQGRVVPATGVTLQGGSDEGSIYGAIFLAYAQQVGLQTAVNDFLLSASAGVRTFGEFRSHIIGQNAQRTATLNQIRTDWSL
jgi:hypothetical protein